MVRLKASDFDRFNAVFKVDVLPRCFPRDKATTLHHSSSRSTCAWVHGRLWSPLEKGSVRAIDHGEFQQRCVDKLITIRDECAEGANRREVLCSQRCRRGGKTFMATAVVLDGNIEPLEADRTKFRDYAYLLRNDDNGKNVHVWGIGAGQELSKQPTSCTRSARYVSFKGI